MTSSHNFSNAIQTSYSDIQATLFIKSYNNGFRPEYIWKVEADTGQGIMTGNVRMDSSVEIDSSEYRGLMGQTLNYGLVNIDDQTINGETFLRVSSCLITISSTDVYHT